MKPIITCAILCGLWLNAASNAADGKPNIILVMPDDAGMGDYSCFGSPILKTPSVDAFRKTAFTLTNFHVSPTCAPTRAALMSGRHEFKNGVTHTIHERERLALDTVTLAQTLQGAGYTTGIFGKWHLGDEAEYQPDRRGFDEVYIHGAGGIGQTYPGSCGDAPGNTNINPALMHNGKFVKTDGYCTDLFFDQAARWIDSLRSQNRPFFAYITPNAPHTPHVLPRGYYEHHIDKAGEKLAKFYGMIENIDTNFGKLLRKLDEWQISENTVVIYLTSDNGGTAGTRIFNAGMRGRKGSAWEGGTRAPSIIRWPGVTKAGAGSGVLTAHIDIYPTLASIAGATLSENVKRQIEGLSLVPLLENPAADWPDRTFFTHVGRWDRGGKPVKFGKCSVRTPHHALVREGDAWQLYDMRRDPGQDHDIAADHPDVVAKLSADYDRWWEEIQPGLVNEDAYQTEPETNPYKELYWRQFGKDDDS
jgi:arylsulfatase